MATLFREWKAHFVYMNTGEALAWTEERYEAEFVVLSEIEDRIDAAEATCLEDLALRLAALTSFDEVCITGFRETTVMPLINSGRV